jgi:glycosyltransferase involved in cell wall biosynthesis
VPKSESELSEAIIKLLRDDDLRRNMGIEGRKKAEKVFDLRQNINKIKEIYFNLFPSCHR